MKLLLLYQGYKIDDQISFYEAFKSLQVDGRHLIVEALPWLGIARDKGWDTLWDIVFKKAQEFRPDVVFFQFFHSQISVGSPKSCILNIRSSVKTDDGFPPLIIGSMGDPYGVGYFFRKLPARSLVDLARMADAFFVSSMGRIARYFEKNGARNIVFLPHAFSKTIFQITDEKNAAENRSDIMMCGSVAISVRHFWFSLLVSVKRWIVACMLECHYGSRLRLFGSGWKRFSSNRGKLAFRNQVKEYRKVGVVVDSPAVLEEVYYGSDRPFFVLGSGTPLVMYYVPRFDKMMRPGIHVHFVHRLRDFPRVCDQVLALPESQKRENRVACIEIVKAHHLFEHRADTILSVVEAIQAIRAGRCRVQEGLEMLRLHHFLSDVDLVEERKHAVLNWKG